MKKLVILLMIGMFVLSACTGDKTQSKNFLDETKEDYDQRMAWWKNARFGMFIHWGLYSVPAGQWKDETGHAEWIRTTAQIPLETYDKFLNDFNPIKYNPAEWVSLAKEAGMKYIVITSKHHDGFCLFDSKYTDFDVMSTPYGKDLLKPLAEECKKQDITMCWYHSIMDWHHTDYLPRRGWEKNRTTKGANFDNYVKYMNNQLTELLTNYGDIGVLWFDGEWETTWNDIHGVKLYNHVRGLQENIIVNNRVGASRGGMAGFSDKKTSAGDFGTPEQEIPATGMAGLNWETCMTMNNHWGFNKYDDNWKSTEDLIHKLIDIASKGGNFLLNVGPKADGTFPDASIKRLKEIGKWMNKNGDAIYGTTASPFKNLNWGRCTQKAMKDGTTNLYLHIFEWPENDKLVVPGLISKVKSAYLFGEQNDVDLSTMVDKSDLIVNLPNIEKDQYATVIVLNIDGKPQVADAPKIIYPVDQFIENVQVEIKSTIKNKEIYYTLDGSEPTNKSKLYSKPIIISKTATLKTRIFINGKPISPLSTKEFQKVKPIAGMNISESSLRNGILCEEYEGNWDLLPDFIKLSPVKTNSVEKISIDNNLEKDYFGCCYSGYIKIEKDDLYQFTTESDDGSKLYINDKLVVDNDGLHGPTGENGWIPLAKGFHKIEVQFFEKTGGNKLMVFYQYGNEEKRELDAGKLFIEK